MELAERFGEPDFQAFHERIGERLFQWWWAKETVSPTGAHRDDYREAMSLIASGHGEGASGVFWKFTKEDDEFKEEEQQDEEEFFATWNRIRGR